jgi:predicted TIM-barrel fold metal-dependent hydrolase
MTLTDPIGRTAAESTPIVDVDSHLVEPVDLWTARMPTHREDDRIPRVEFDPEGDEYRWRVGGVWLSAVGEYCSAGWYEHVPSHPDTLELADPACYDAKARVAKLDAYNIRSQVLYPNLISFDTMAFLNELGPELALECVQVYNDYLVEFASVDPSRFIPVMMVPYWDVDATIKEMERSKATGHKGMLFAALLGRVGMPNIWHEQWKPVLSAAQDLQLPMCFHIGFGARDSDESKRGWSIRTKTALAVRTERQSFVAWGGSFFGSTAQAAAHVLARGICHDYPGLKFVAVESGFGYFPFMLEELDWLWQTSGAFKDYPERELPSYYFRRQYYVTMWHETAGLPLLEEYQDNVMFESDFPHETGLCPGPASPSLSPRETVVENLSDLDPVVVRKVLHDNAARVYDLD